MSPEDEVVRLLSVGLLDIRATAWGAVVGTDPEAQLALIAEIADALHNLPGTDRDGAAATALAYASKTAPPDGWLARVRDVIAREP